MGEGITSDPKSPGSLKDWKNLIVISGQVVKDKVLKSGNYTHLSMEGGLTRISTLIWEGVVLS